MRRIAERVGAEHQYIVEAERIPVDPAEAGDGGGPLHAQHADGDPVTQLEFEGIAQSLVNRNQRLAGVAFGPPFACGQAVALRQFFRIGQPALAAQRPGAVGDFLEIGDPHHEVAGAIGQHGAAQRWNSPHHRLRSDPLGGSDEIRRAVLRHVEHEEIGGFLRHARGDIGIEAGLHRR